MVQQQEQQIQKNITIAGLAYGYYAVIPSGEGYTPFFYNSKIK